MKHQDVAAMKHHNRLDFEAREEYTEKNTQKKNTQSLRSFDQNMWINMIVALKLPLKSHTKEL